MFIIRKKGNKFRSGAHLQAGLSRSPMIVIYFQLPLFCHGCESAYGIVIGLPLRYMPMVLARL